MFWESWTQCKSVLSKKFTIQKKKKKEKSNSNEIKQISFVLWNVAIHNIDTVELLNFLTCQILGESNWVKMYNYFVKKMYGIVDLKI